MTSNSHDHDKTAADAVSEVQAVQSKQDAQGLISRLARWLDRDRWPVPSETRTLFSARLTDVAANRLAQADSLQLLVDMRADMLRLRNDGQLCLRTGPTGR